ncbi:hypothetical protein Tco_0578699 [Tanacetum coccineum]
MYVPGFPGYPMQDPQSDSANRKLKQVVGSPKNKKPNERDLLDDEKLRPFGEKIMGSVFGKVKRLSGEDESSESDEDAETTPVANKNFKEDKFWNMPPLLKTPVLDMKKKGGGLEEYDIAKKLINKLSEVGAEVVKQQLESKRELSSKSEAQDNAYEMRSALWRHLKRRVFIENTPKDVVESNIGGQASINESANQRRSTDIDLHKESNKRLGLMLSSLLDQDL